MWKILCLTFLFSAVAGDEFLSRKGATRARCLLQGWASDAQAKDLLKVAQELAGSGSNTGGPYDALDAGITLVGVETPSGSWQFMLQKPQAAKAGSSHVVAVHSHHRGDATEQQEADLIRFAESCFSNTDVDTSNLGSLQLTLGNSVDCVLQRCLEAWGFKPEESVYGSDAGGPYEAYGLGATVIGVESPSGKWDFVLHLK
ncbi:unnamed protein product [Symbiodinium sp. CCMP2592]|nr:unnamed protein product [Symbiodinium sp. CCMP2592]